MKKILFLNTTKLAVLSAMLLLAVFCTIGMSFTPAEEGENVGNPNDSTYVTGPRRGHWKTTQSGCTTYHNLTDYGKASVIIVGNGTITTTGTNKTHTASQKDSTLTITWNTGFGDKDETGDKTDELDNLHSNTVTFTATADEGHIFSGWYSDADCTLKLSEDHEYSRTYTIPGVIYANSENEKEQSYENKDNPWDGGTIYAKFIEVTPVDLTFIAPGERGTIKVTIAEENTLVTDANITKYDIMSEVTLAAEAKDGYIFAGWYTKDSKGQVTEGTLNTSLSKIFAEDCSIGALFISKTNPPATFRNITTNTDYYGLRLAALTAKSEEVIIPLDDCTVDGCDLAEGMHYTIPAGVTLLIPNSEVKMMKIPTYTGDKETLSIYRTLTLAKDVQIEVNGTICVAGRQYSATSGSNPAPGQPVGSCGALDMKQGGSVIIKSNASLYAYGFVVGTGDQSTSGTITVENGGQVYENFIIADISGGGGTAACVNGTASSNNYELFPFNQYFIQNIEPKLTVEYGAALYAVFCIEGVQEPVNMIGANNTYLFQQEEGEGTAIVKWYDYTRDYLCYEIRGKSHMNSINVSVGFGLINMSISSSKFILPITHNTDITLAQNSELEIAADIKFLPGVNLTIEKDAKAVVKGALYLYDSAQWDYYSIAYAQVVQNPVLGHTTRTVKPLDAFSDVSLVIDGELIIQGTNAAVYTTESGANITSNGNGKVIYDGVGALNTPSLWERYGTYGRNASGGFLKQEESVPEETYNQEQVGTYWFAKQYYMYGTPISCTPAKLHNGEEWYKDKADELKKEYLATAGVSASTTIQYANNHWGWMEIWKDHDGTLLNINNTCTQTNNSSAYEHNVLPEGYTFIGWNTEVNNINQEVIHTAQYTFGPELDIVDADNTKKTLTINANGWASSGWPYTVDGVKYDKGDREDDRTLIIPYNGTAGASLPIAVLDKDGKPICRHIYKVPFVYTGTEDMSDMNENSIVFVKSGTLTVGTASAKEIYVADSAELKVTGTLTVGKLVLRTTPYKAAVLTNNGTINGQVYYSRISPDAKQYYQFGLPLLCPLANVKMSNTGKLGGSQPKYGTAWVLKSYSESLRAQNGISKEGANWVSLENTNNTGVITAGVGYEMFSNSNYYREFYFPVDLTTATNKVSVQYTDGTIAEHNGWNIITSPLTSRANVPIIDPATDFKVCWLNEDGSYRQELPTVFPPAIPFSIQASAGGELNFAVPTIAAAPRKQSAAEALTETEWVHLDIFDAYGEGDETSLFIHPTRFEQTYKTGIDMAKQSLTASRAILYTTHAYGDMAFAGVADSLLENGIDLIVYSPAEQELTISLRENAFLNRLEYLWLADNETGARTDLLMNDYTFRADAGTIKGRFVLNGRFKAPQISTGIDHTQTDYNIYAIGNNIAISGVEQGTPIYIFDAVGHMIYTTAATSDEVIVPAPCAGVYMLTIGGQTAKLVINQ